MKLRTVFLTTVLILGLLLGMGVLFSTVLAAPRSPEADLTEPRAQVASLPVIDDFEALIVSLLSVAGS